MPVYYSDAADIATIRKAAGGKSMPGLVRRRAAERELCLRGLS